MATAIVDFTDLARRRLVVVEELGNRHIKRVSQHLRLGVVEIDGKMFERGAQGREFAQRIPAQVPFLEELLHMLRRRAPCSCLEQATAGKQRHDRQHLGAGSQFEDREEIGQIVAQHVAGDRNGVFPLADALDGIFHGVDRRQDFDFQTLGVMVLEIALDLGDHVSVVGALLVEPEHRGSAGRPRAIDRQLDPVLNRNVLDARHAPNIARLDLMLDQCLAGRIDHAYRAILRNHESGRV